jgi:hypothetical protein
MGVVNNASGLGLSRLEARIRALEQQTRGLQGSGATAATTGGVPPKPTGVTYSRQPGVIAFEWDDSPIGDLLHYRIQISDNVGMTNATEYTTVDPRYTYYAGVSGVTYYARVATKNRSQRSSDFTTAVSTTIGTTVAVDADATGTDTTYVQVQFTSSSYETSSNYFATSDWWPAKLNSTTTMSITVTIPDDGTWVVLILGVLSAKGDNNQKDAFNAQIAIDGVKVGVPGGSTHADLATGRRHGASPFYIHTGTTPGATYVYTVEGQATDQQIDQLGAQMGTLLIRTA